MREPYGAVVIYDGSINSKNKLLKDAIGNRAEAMYVSFFDITDQSITKVPALLVPFQTSAPIPVKLHHL